MKSKISLGGAIYTFMWLMIAMVSSVDIYWSVRLHESLAESELNPLGQIIMHADSANIALFMGLKTFGTFLVLGFLTIFYKMKRRMAWGVIVGVFLFQMWLLFFLTLYEPKHFFSNSETMPKQQYNNNDIEPIMEAEFKE
jgi:hypothetical protein